MVFKQRELAAGLILIALVAVGCDSEEAKPEDSEVPPVPVETLVLAATDFVERVEVSGVAQPIHEVTVAAEAPGRITTAPFEEGKTIEKGALLVRVDAQSGSAQVDLLQNQLAAAEREYARTKMLASEGLATPQQLDQASSSVDSARLSIRQARVGIGKSTVKSPQAGIVSTKYVEEGEYAAPGAPIAHIVDYSTVVIEAAVPEGDIPFVTAGRSVKVFLPALERHVTGEVKRRAIVATAKTRTYPVEVWVQNDDLSILPGMRARVIIPRKTWSDVVVLPRDAILQGYEAKEAMVLPGKGDVGEAELRKLELGPARGNEVVVKSGLAAGDRLIVKGHRSIVSGTRVKSVRERKSGPNQEPAAAADSAAQDGTNGAAAPRLADGKSAESATN